MRGLEGPEVNAAAACADLHVVVAGRPCAEDDVARTGAATLWRYGELARW
jgi:hypothetical protein